MAPILVLLFVLVPLLEIFVIVQVAGAVGGWVTFGLLVADSLVGAWLLRVEGRRAWAQFRTALAEGRWPGDEVAQGALVIVGGTLLLTPGFVTDVVGFLLLIGGTRRIVADQVRKRFAMSAAGAASGRRDPRHGSPRRPRQPGEVSLDVEVVEIEREIQRPAPPEESGPGGAPGQGDARRDDNDDSEGPGTR